ncbi:MAG: biotin synthase BioB [Thermodesulfobacteriota bacterium]
MSLASIFSRAAENRPLTDAEVRALLDVGHDQLPEMLSLARELARLAFGRTVSLCAIVNAKSGACPEDCAFCAQSAHGRADAPRYALVDLEKVLDAARQAQAAGARRFSVVLSGAGPEPGEFALLLDMVRAITLLGLQADTSPGILGREQLAALKEAGLAGYHHNLETARSFFPNICTTHAYDEDVAAVAAAKELGLYVCSGGIFGLGESWEQRAELLLDLRALEVDSVPVNFLNPIPGTPLEHRPVLAPSEAQKILALARFLLPRAAIRVCGGRPAVFGAQVLPVLSSGASGLMIGDYLTVRGADPAEDLRGVVAAGLEPG